MQRHLLYAVVQCSLLVASGYFHLYEDNIRIPESCPKDYDKAPSQDDIKRWKLWPNLLSSLGKGESIYGFTEAMDIIYKNQHPPDCKNAKFLIGEGWLQGFGSQVHIEGIGLGVALQLGRVYVPNPLGPGKNSEVDHTWHVTNSYCQKQGKTTLECYYEPWTHCSVEDIMGNKTIAQLKQARDKTYFSDTNLIRKEMWNMNLQEKTILMENRGDTPWSAPPVFESIVRCSKIPKVFWSYWWRAMSAAYTLRPNAYTLQQFDKYPMDFDPQKEQCVSVYVRQGDKHVESPIMPTFLQHATAAKVMWDTGLVTGEIELPSARSGNQKPVMFVGSEDALVIEEAQQWGKKHNWRVLYTDLFDRRSVSAGLNFTQQKTQKKTATGLVHHDLEYFNMLLNLNHHLRCNAFVCMMMSNFCRLIDELRSTIAGKANRHIADTSERCPMRPCIDRFIWVGY